MNGKKYTIKDAFNYYKYNVSKLKDATCIVCNKNDDSFDYFSEDKCLSGDFYIIGSIDEFKSYERSLLPNSVKPVYTQEMVDNGELPTVGCKVILRCNFDSKTVTHTGIVLFSSGDNCILATDYGEAHFNMDDYTYEPIDTRTDKERLVDELKSCLLLPDEKSCGDKVDFAHFEQHANDLLNKFDIKLK